MHIVFHRHLGNFFGRLKQGTDIDIKSKIRKAGGDDLDSTIMTVLSHFRYQYSGPPPLFFLELFGSLEQGVNDFIFTVLGNIHPGNTLGGGHIAPELLFEGVGNFANGCSASDGFDTQLQQVIVGCGSSGQGFDRFLDGLVIAGSS